MQQYGCSVCLNPAADEATTSSSTSSSHSLKQVRSFYFTQGLIYRRLITYCTSAAISCNVNPNTLLVWFQELFKKTKRKKNKQSFTSVMNTLLILTCRLTVLILPRAPKWLNWTLGTAFTMSFPSFVSHAQRNGVSGCECCLSAPHLAFIPVILSCSQFFVCVVLQSEMTGIKLDDRHQRQNNIFKSSRHLISFDPCKKDNWTASAHPKHCSQTSNWNQENWAHYSFLFKSLYWLAVTKSRNNTEPKTHFWCQYRI